MSEIQYLNVQDLTNYQRSLTDLLLQCVHNGASIGFLPDEPESHYVEYWQGVAADLVKHKTFLWMALQQGQVVGTVQLVRAMKANARHRAEIEKLMVHPYARQQGIAYQLLNFAEQQAKTLGLKLLVLDTRQGDVSEKLYLKYGFQRAGEIPIFAMSHDGELNATTLFYKIL